MRVERLLDPGLEPRYVELAARLQGDPGIADWQKRSVNTDWAPLRAGRVKPKNVEAVALAMHGANVRRMRSRPPALLASPRAATGRRRGHVASIAPHRRKGNA